MFGIDVGEVVVLLLIAGAVIAGAVIAGHGLLGRERRPDLDRQGHADASRTTSLRVMVVGSAVVGLGLLLLFLPTSTSYEGTRLECGSAFAPDSVNEAAYDCAIDEQRFAAVAVMTGGAFAASWPACGRPCAAPRSRSDAPLIRLVTDARSPCTLWPWR